MADEDSRCSANSATEDFEKVATDLEHFMESDSAGSDGDSDDDLADKNNGTLLTYSIIDKGLEVGTAGLPVKVEKIQGGRDIVKLGNLDDTEHADNADEGSEGDGFVVGKQQVRVPVRNITSLKDSISDEHTLVTVDTQQPMSSLVTQVQGDGPDENIVMLMDIYNCGACNEVFLSVEALTEHSLTHKDSCICKLCGKAFTNTRAIKLHKKFCSRSVANLAAEERGAFECRECKKLFNYRSVLKAHMKSHSAEMKCFMCSACDKSFTKERDLLRHSYTHSSNKPFICDRPDCGKGFTCKSSLNKHIQLKHQKDVKIYRCQTCGKTFQVESDIQRHIYTHTDIRPFKCDQCSKSYTCKSSLRQHILLTHEKKKLSCVFCSKSFNLKQDLERHMHTHTGTKPWQCRVCKKRYTCKSALAVHKRNAHDTCTVYDDEKKEIDEMLIADDDEEQEVDDMLTDDENDMDTLKTEDSDVDTIKAEDIVIIESLVETDKDAEPHSEMTIDDDGTCNTPEMDLMDTITVISPLHDADTNKTKGRPRKSRKQPKIIKISKMEDEEEN